MKLLIKFRNAENYNKKIYIDKNEYIIDNDEIYVDTPSEWFELKIITYKTNKISLIKYVRYYFSFHKEDSLGFFQCHKLFNYCEHIYKSKVHRDSTLIIDLQVNQQKNSFDIYDSYIETNIYSKNNIELLEVNPNSDLKESIVKKCLMFETIFLLLKCFFVGIICAAICYGIYYYRYEMRTIFQGDFIWVNISIFIIAYIIYIISTIFRINKLKK